MTIEAEGPNGEILEFPDDTPPNVIQAAIKKHLGASKQPEDKGEMSAVTRGAQGFNVGLAKGVGLPVDLVNSAFSFFGLGSEAPVGGSKYLQSKFASMGMAPEPGTEREQLGNIGRVTEEIGAAAAPYGVLGTAAKAGWAGGKYMKPVIDFLRAKPKTAAVAELSSATGAGVGAVVANEAFPGNPLAEVAGQLVGGMVSSPSIFAETSPAIIRNVRKAVKIATSEEGAKDVAAQIVQKSVRNKQQAVSNLQDAEIIPGQKLTSGQQSGDAGLLALEKSALKKSEELKDGVAEALTATNRAASEELQRVRGGGSPGVLRASLEDRVAYLRNLLSVRTSQAISKASDAVAKLSPGTPRSKANLIVRKEIDEAYDAARAQETELWNAVPDDISVDISGTRDTYAKILKARDRRIENPADIPAWISRLFSGKRGIRGEIKISRAQKLRSRLLSEIRDEKGKEVPNRNKIRIYSQLSDSILDAMSAGAGDEIALARTFSKDLNERFTQGTVGDLLGFSRTGELEVPPQLTLESTVRNGQRGNVALEDINRAVGVQTSPQDMSFTNTSKAVSDFIADRFISRFPTGEVNPTTGKRFLMENREILDKFPELKTDIENAVKSQENASAFIQRKAAVERRLADKRKTAASVYLGGDPGTEVRFVLNSKNPTKNMESLVRSARKDKSGEALAGLRAGVIDDAMKSSMKAGTDLDQNQVINGQALLNYIKSNQGALSAALSEEQMRSLNRVATAMKKAQSRVMSGYPGNQLIDESPDAFTDAVLSAVGANIGGGSALGRATGAPLVMAQRGAAAVRKIGRKWISKIPAGKVTSVIDEAILNPDLMVELLKRPKSIEGQIEQYRAIRGFLINIIPEAFREPLTIEVQEEQ